jgi:hypothetical protein
MATTRNGKRTQRDNSPDDLSGIELRTWKLDAAFVERARRTVAREVCRNADHRTDAELRTEIHELLGMLGLV